MCVALLVLVPGPLPAAESCFPPDAPVDPFHRSWYCKHLAAGGLGLLAGDLAFRFIHLPTFDPPRVVTVTVESGTPVVVGIVLGGAGGYEPGQPKQRTRRVLKADEIRLLMQRLENAGVWEPPDTDVRTGVDGSRWILEARKNGRYQLHDVWSPDARTFPQFVKVATYMLELAGITPEEGKLY